MDPEDRELLREVLEIARELLKVFREYEPLLKKLRSPVKPPWKR
jgi:hypothetical protein